MSRLRVAVIGAGNIAQQHLPVLTNHPACEVAVLCDVNPAMLAESAERFGIAEREESPDALLRRDDLDAVYVLVSVLHVARVASKFIAAGLPTFVEKPPGICSADTGRLAELAEKHGTVAMVGVNRRFYSNNLAVRARMAELGPLATITVEAHEDQWRLYQPDRLTKFTQLVRRRWAYANGIHALDMLRFFGGDVADIHAIRSSYHYDYPDSFSAVLRFTSGAQGRALVDWFAPANHRYELRTVGARAVSGHGFNTITVSVRDRPDEQFVLDEQDRQYKAGFWRQATAFLDGARSGRQPPFPAASLADAHRTMQMIDGICQLSAEVEEDREHYLPM